MIDLSGRFLSQETISIGSRPEAAIGKIIACIEMLRDRYSKMTFEGVGVSVPGRVDPVTQRILMAPNLNWHDFDLKSTLEKKLKLQVETR